jgi:hypothetical protein
MKRLSLLITVILLVILHQDFWNWRDARPLVFGFIPISLFYHVCYTLSVSVLMWVMVKIAWPAHLEETVESEDRETQPKEPLG